MLEFIDNFIRKDKREGGLPLIRSQTVRNFSKKVLFGRCFRRLRKEKNFTLMQIKNATRIGRSSLHDYDSGKSIPVEKNVDKIIDFFESKGINAEEIKDILK